MPISWAMKSCLRRWASSRRSRKSPSNFAPLKSASSPRLNRKIRSISEYVNSRSRRSATSSAGDDEPVADGAPLATGRARGDEHLGAAGHPVRRGEAQREDGGVGDRVRRLGGELTRAARLDHLEAGADADAPVDAHVDLEALPGEALPGDPVRDLR